MNSVVHNPFYAYGLTDNNELFRYPVPTLEYKDGEEYSEALERQGFLKTICTTGHYPTKTDFEIRRRLYENSESEWLIGFWLEQKKCIYYYYYANGINEFHIMMSKIKLILDPIKLALEINVLECTLSKLIHEA